MCNLGLCFQVEAMNLKNVSCGVILNVSIIGRIYRETSQDMNMPEGG